MIYNLRKIQGLIIATFILLMSTPIANAQTNNGLLLWWKLDNNAGASATDSSGNGYTGTITNAPTWVTGRYGYALKFVAASDQYVVSPTLGTPPNSITLAAWIYSGAAGGVVFAELGQATINSGWHDSQIEVEASGTVKTCIWTGAESCVSATTNLGFNQWHYVALTYNVTTHLLSGYYDGKLGASATLTKSYNTPTFYAIGPIDSTNGGNGVYFTGIIDEVRIYNRALSPGEIYEVFENGAPDYMGSEF
jgi:hypothetical protein